MAGYDYDSDSSGGNPYDEIDGPFMGLGNGGENEDIHVKDLKDACKLAWETAQNLEAFADGVEKTVGHKTEGQALGVVTRLPVNCLEDELVDYLLGCCRRVRRFEGIAEPVVGCRMKRDRTELTAFVTFASDELLSWFIYRARQGQLRLRAGEKHGGFRIHVKANESRMDNYRKCNTTVQAKRLDLLTWGPGDSLHLVWSHEGRVDVTVRYVEKRLALMFNKPQPPPKPDPLGRKISKGNKDVFGNPIHEEVSIRVSAELKLKQLWQVRSFAQEDEEHLYIVVHGRPFLFETREVAKQMADYAEEAFFTRIVDTFTGCDAFAGCQVYRLTLDPCKESDQLLIALDQFRVVGNTQGPMHSWNEPEVARSPFKNLPARVNNFTKKLEKKLEFEVHYLIHCLVSAGIMPVCALGEDLVDLLTGTETKIAVWALSKMLMVSGEVIRDPIKWLKIRIDDYRPGRIVRYKDNIPNGYAVTRHVLITPLRIVCLPPEVESSNRVLREYQDQSDRFVRVTFVDETLGTMYSRGLDQLNDVYDKYEKFWNEGLNIAGRHFDFLAFSTSQLREHGCWFFSECEVMSGKSRMKVTCNGIRAWLGDFSRIKCPAKYAARMGQCFSATVGAVEVPWQQRQVIDDEERNGYCFTDGVGRLSPELVEEVRAMMKLEYKPSAFQVRYAGAKGVLCTYPDMPTNKKIQLRKSMVKFQTTHDHLEIIQASRRKPGFLNRQVILLLSNLGIKDDVFLRYQGDMLASVNAMMWDPELAVKFCGWFCDSEPVRHARAGIKAGMGLGDAFIRGMLSALRNKLLWDLRRKARVAVAEAAMVMGVADDYGDLEYGQVFLQVSDENTGEPIPVLGRVVIAKNPAFHPGDVRVFEAVRAPHLTHLVDVVVFPVKGDRPHPNELSGSDLDGDEYCVIWDKNFIPRRGNYDAMDYTSAPPREVASAVTIRDVGDFFFDFMRNANLGQVANAHLAAADKSNEGVMDEKCITLAMLHSMAVDYPKTGIPAELTPELRTMEYPDFMENFKKPMRKSEKVLGQMYREVVRIPTDARPVDNAAVDIDLVLDGHEQYLADAKHHSEDYVADILDLMHAFGVFNELELISGRAVRFCKLKNRKASDSQERLTEAVRLLWRHYREIFLHEFELHDGAEDAPKVDAQERIMQKRRKASAWYVTGYQRAHVGGDRLACVSFAWIMGDILVQIKESASAALAAGEDEYPSPESFISEDGEEKDQFSFALAHSEPQDL